MEVMDTAAYGFLPTERLHPYAQPHHHHQPAGDDELWEYFPCPFCYIEVEVPFLCHHLQEEHCFDMKNTVCPMCADNIGKDMATHIRIQHSHLLKRRKPSKPSSAAEKEAYEANSYFEVPQQCISRHQTPDAAPDPLLLQFISSVAPVDAKSGEEQNKSDASPVSDDQRSNQHVIDDASKQELEERLQRIKFVKQMLMTTIIQTSF